MLTVKSVDEVMRVIEDSFSGYYLEAEITGISEALGRITAEDVAACEDVPEFNRSSVDGYAVIASDTYGCSDSIPAQLEFSGEVDMGARYAGTVAKGKTVYVPTGGELPEGADAVVMIEYADDPGDGYIYMNKPAAPGNNVVYKGDDIKAGNAAIKPGTRLRAQDIGVLAALGMDMLSVKKRIRVGIISTGDELVDIRVKPTGSQVRDINSHSLSAGLLAYGAEPVMYGIVRDDYADIRNAVDIALAECDVVMISGGSSVGFKDETLKVINSFGAPGALVHGIAVKPGKPTIIGKVRGKAVVGLPGHPASAFMIFHVFVHRLLDVLNNTNSEYRSTVKAVVAHNYPSNTGREELLPVKLNYADNRIYACPVFGKSGLISLLSSADGYIRIGRSTEGLASGEAAEVILF